MEREREIERTLQECIFIMVRHHGRERADRSHTLLVAEIHTVAGWMMELDPDADEMVNGIILPLQNELLRSYGHEVGCRLYATFLGAFEGVDATVPGAGMGEGPS